MVAQVVTVQRAMDVIGVHEMRAARRYLGARSYRLRCHFEEARPHGRAAAPITCTFRAYRHVDGSGRIVTAQLFVSVVGRVPSSYRHDFSGAAAYSSGRSLALDRIRA